MGDAGDHPCAGVLVAVSLLWMRVAFGPQVIWPQEGELESRAE